MLNHPSEEDSRWTAWRTSTILPLADRVAGQLKLVGKLLLSQAGFLSESLNCGRAYVNGLFHVVDATRPSPACQPPCGAENEPGGMVIRPDSFCAVGIY